MRKIMSTLLFLCALSIGVAQTEQEKQEIIRTYDLEKLSELEITFRKEEEASKERALVLAREYGWEVEGDLPNRNQFELMGFIKNKPIQPLYYETENRDAWKITRVKHLNTNAGLGLDLEGDNMTAFVWDGGITRETHKIFDGNGGDRASTGDGTNDMRDHATHVTGTIIGRKRKRKARGMAPAATAINHDWDTDLAEATAQAAGGALLSNHSYGWRIRDNQNNPLPAQLFGSYVGESRNWDMLMFNAPFYLMVKSAGNNGEDDTANANPLNGNAAFDKLVGRATAKNNLVVASINDVDTDRHGNIDGTINRSGFSSEGPTDDLRIKPDISGNGDNLYSSGAAGNRDYYEDSGTSMSAPNVTGSLLLVQEHHNNVTGNFMRAATLKGLALHTADDAGIVGPDAEFGWGLLNTMAAADLITENGSSSIIRELNLQNGETYEIYVVTSCDSNPEDLTASISWTDPAGPILGGTNNPNSVLVNDLDITVSRGATVLRPWRLTGVNTNATGDNTVDPYERVDVVNPQSGVYTIRVTHKGSLTNGNQRFSLIVSGISHELFEGIAPENYDTITNVQGDGLGVHTYPNLVGDVDGDGDDDIVFIGQNWSGVGLNIRTKFSNGDGTWTHTSDIQGDGAGVHTYPAMMGDVNGDGRDDIVFIGQNWSGAGLNIRTKFSNGDGTWTHTSDIQGDGAGVHTYPAMMGDVNGDGRADIVFVGQNWSGAGLNIRTKLSNGNGTWTHTSDIQGDGVGVHTNPSMIGDVNGDGFDDLVFIGQNWSGAGLNIRTKFSNGDGTWTHTSDIHGDGSGVHTYPPMMGDVNGDGRADIVFVGQNWSGAGLNIRTKFSNGDGSWTHTSDIQGDGAGVHQRPTLTGDFNGDCKMDLLFTAHNWNCANALHIRTKLSVGNGTWFHNSEWHPDGSGVMVNPTLIGDMNADDKSDIIFVGQNWSGAGLNIRSKVSLFDSEGCFDCSNGPIADAKFVNPNAVNSMPSFYGPIDVSELCLVDPMLVDGSASQCEDRYFLEVIEFDLINWATVGTPLYSNWVCTACTAPNNINITDYVSLGDLDPSKVYKFKLAVGSPWNETNKFFTVTNCFTNPNDTSMRYLEQVTQKMEEIAVEIEGTQEITSEIKVYPNPSKDYVFVSFNEVPFQNTIYVYDLLGNEILKQEAVHKNQRIAMQDLASGLYILIVKNEQQQPIKVAKVIKE